MSLKLYYAPGACSFVPHTLLETTGAVYEPMMIRLHKGEQASPEYRAINPRAQVPVLVDGDTVITQIVAICGYLDAKFPEQEFLPKPPLARARALETLAWMNNTVHPTFTHIFMPQHFTDNQAAQAEIKKFNTEKYRSLLGELDAIAAKASPWISGARFGPLDAYALTLMRWGGFAGIAPQTNRALWSFSQRVAALAPVARAMEREKLQLDVTAPK